MRASDNFCMVFRELWAGKIYTDIKHSVFQTTTALMGGLKL